MRHNIESILEKVADKYRRAIPAAQELNTLPYRSENGQWIGSPNQDGNSWWTTGFWSGILWQLYNLTGDEAFRTEALRGDEEMAKEFRKYIRLNHDMAFMYLLSCGAEYKLTGSEQARVDALMPQAFCRAASIRRASSTYGTARAVWAGPSSTA